VKGSYRDGATQQGAGYLATYPADVWFPPIIGIDHVLLSRAQSAHIATVRVAGSDHRGLLATIRLDP
jgi:endonuclease/exonuclease/phosphatase family metal-dependent hydrolase